MLPRKRFLVGGENSLSYKFNPFTGTFDLIGDSSSVSIPELDSDPISPAAESAWVLKYIEPQNELGHTLLHFGMTFGSEKYKLKYKTKSGKTVSVNLQE